MTASDTPLTSDFGGRERYDGATTTDGPGQSRQRLGTPDLAPTYMEVDMDSARPEPTDDDRAKAIVVMSQALESDRLTVGYAIMLVAQLLADQRATIHARYVAYGQECADKAGLHGILRDIRKIAEQ